ncbi:MAG: hypothetical protein A3E36_03040 [Candidatus Andersenbacteria bacterium RIFCSPHIGHO2_12_FULL_45_11b]|uniref:Probable cytosol aminopeptidase n=1 Tax=Candidatus Andersenbacteria bacterium RIFCSPHIGHO2_12_FULL_45_11b TaxID=1797282 RepID=A0A1G1XDK9_9BACT|nr:MAG: hypothetical protein A3E36_03040 [Candidatus Andersenbacteria bacterium RIFCSPHIGHO2_12_FULL_45_11b]
MFSISISGKSLADAHADIAVIPVGPKGEVGTHFSKEVHAHIAALMKRAEFAGQWGRAEMFIAPAGAGFPLIALIGTGKSDDFHDVQSEGLRRAIATVLVNGRSHVARRVAIVLPSTASAQPITEALLLTNYWFAEHSKALTQDERIRSLQEAVLILPDKKDMGQVKKLVQRAQKVMNGVSITRNLVNQPASHMSPKVLAAEAKKIAKTSPRISLKVLNRAQAQQKKFFGFLAVARGSKEEPQVIHLTYTPALRQAQGKQKKTLVVIGKGITFDSGGLSLKPAQHMENMKIDMGGGATVLGLFSLLPMLAPDIAVHGIIAACENMPSGDAYRPGDVIATMSGKTIEVLNTDAEGRITLADALTYAQTLKPDAIIDLATLTGACVVALGDTHAGLFGNNQELNALILESAKQSGEGLVEFPLPEEYRPTVQSMVGDVRNTSAMRMGRAITAALFLQEFIEKNKAGQAVPWAHLDIAGPVYDEMPLIPYWQFGATGYGVRTLVNVVERFGK